MIFLLEYDRAQKKLVSFTEYDDSNLRAAESARLALELQRIARTRSERSYCCRLPARPRCAKPTDDISMTFRTWFVEQVSKAEASHVRGARRRKRFLRSMNPITTAPLK